MSTDRASGFGQLDDQFVLAALPAFLKWWHGDEGDDTPYEIVGAALDALRSLPVAERMEAMGMIPVQIDRDGEPYYGGARLPSSVLDDLWTGA